MAISVFKMPFYILYDTVAVEDDFFVWTYGISSMNIENTWFTNAQKNYSIIGTFGKAYLVQYCLLSYRYYQS